MPIKIIFCYAREDEELLKKLKTHLRPLEREGQIDIWYDRNISAGTEWEKEITNQLNVAQIILLLISPDFMASDYCYSIELKRAIERHERKEARVIPVILRHAFWQVKPLKKLQASPDDAKPVISSNWHNPDEALVNVVEGIRKVALELARSCDLLFYNPLHGMSEFYSIDDQGNYSLLEQYKWQNIWTQIIPGKFTDSEYTGLLLYSNSTGEAKFLTTNNRGGYKEIRYHPGWYKDWTCIIPGNFTESKYTDLLFYSASTGEGEIYTTDGHGQINSLRKYTGWQNVWTQIIPGKFTDSKYTDLLFYSNSTGRAHFYTTYDTGALRDFRYHPGWYKDWTCIIPGNFTESKYTDLFFYSASTGEGEIYTTDGHGQINSLRKHAGWSKDWKHIIPGKFTDGKYTDLLFHNPSKGRVKIFTTDGRGGINLLKEHSNWQKHSTEVIYLTSV